ncbi:DUF6624 domain-containing protein [Streptomyces diacarni]|uniref:DUF6624 domain-containing protein n=1 Tax=Streptomyces diacarni TaxID=2800381 RepID=UPI0033D6E93A
MAPRPPAPRRSDLAEDLIGRAAAARTHWSAPAHQRPPDTDDLALEHQQEVSNARALRRIVAAYNRWPGRSLVGADGCQAATEIALHTDHDPAFQRLLLRLLGAAVEQNEATPAQWAHLHDRCLARTGEPQLFGTQHWYRPDGRIEVHTIDDEGELDARRASVGLPPFAEQARHLRDHHLPPPPLSTSPATETVCADERRAA